MHNLVFERKPFIQARYILSYIDFQKAFDSIDNSMVNTNLERLGIRGTLNGLMAISSEIRNNLESLDQNKKMEINESVPQESIFAPSLSLWFTNDMHQIFPNSSKKTLFIDDMTIQKISKSSNKTNKAICKNSKLWVEKQTVINSKNCKLEILTEMF